MDKKLAVITVLYENYTILSDFFDSFDKQNDSDFQIYVIDNSTNKKNITYPEYVTYIPIDNNGYAHAVNIGVKQALQDGLHMFSVINSDVVVQEDFIKNVKKSIHNNPQSLIGGKIYYYKGFEYHKGKYNEKDLGKVLWYAGGTSDWDNCLTQHRGVDEVDKGKYNNFEKTDFITGCLMCYNQKVLKTIGTWDESYFLYFEDADYCERAKRAGLSLFYDPSIVIWHKNAQSTEGSGSKLHLSFQRKNQLRFGLKYAPFRTKIHLVKNYFLNLIQTGFK